MPKRSSKKNPKQTLLDNWWEQAPEFHKYPRGQFDVFLGAWIDLSVELTQQGIDPEKLSPEEKDALLQKFIIRKYGYVL